MDTKANISVKTSRRILSLLIACFMLSSCVWRPTYDRASFLADSLRYELALEKKQRIQLQEYETDLYYRYVEKNPRYINHPIKPRKHFEEDLYIPPVNTPEQVQEKAPPPPMAEPPEISRPKPKEEIKEVVREDVKPRIPDLNETIAFPNMRVRNAGSSKIISFPEGAFFESGSTQLTPRAKKYLADFAKDMAERENYMIDIEGHTDDTEESREAGIEDRWDLSAIRATRVLRELVKLGVSPYRVIASGRGQFKPRVPNKPARNKKQNRRIEIRITPIGPNN